MWFSLITTLITKRLKKLLLPAIISLSILGLAGYLKVKHNGWIEDVRANARQQVLQEMEDEDVRRAREIMRRVQSVARPRPVFDAAGVQRLADPSDTRGYRD